jgi:hypothetical protein
MKLTDTQWNEMVELLKEMYGKISNFSSERYDKKSQSWTVWFSETFGTSQITFKFANDQIVWFDGEGWRTNIYELEYL